MTLLYNRFIDREYKLPDCIADMAMIFFMFENVGYSINPNSRRLHLCEMLSPLNCDSISDWMILNWDWLSQCTTVVVDTVTLYRITVFNASFIVFKDSELGSLVASL